MTKYIITESKHEKIWYFTHDKFDSWSTLVSLCRKFDSIGEAITIADRLTGQVEILQVSVVSK